RSRRPSPSRRSTTSTPRSRGSPAPTHRCPTRAISRSSRRRRRIGSWPRSAVYVTRTVRGTGARAMGVTKVVMPKLSDAMESGKIIKWLKKEGDRIQGGDILAEVETDKADVEMEAFGAGVLRKILVPAGDTAPIGTLIGVIAEPGEDITALIASAAGGGAGAGSGAQKTPLRPEPAPAP